MTFQRVRATMQEKKDYFTKLAMCGGSKINNTKLMLQFCRNRLKTEQNCRTLSLMFIQNYMQNLNKILVSNFGN